MASLNLKNIVGVPNLGQNCYFSLILQLLKCYQPVQDLIFTHLDQCLHCLVTNFNKEVMKGQEDKFLCVLY